MKRTICGMLALACCLGATAQRAGPPPNAQGSLVPTAAQATLPPAVQTALARANVPTDALAAIAVPLFRGNTWEWRADVPMQPASTMKLVTSIVALDRLGTTLRGRTELLATAPVVGGVLQGDLTLRGGADPDLGVAQFWQMLMELREQGVREIAGDLVVDRTLFRPARPELGVPPFDEHPEFPYNVIPDALQLAGSLMPLELSADDTRLAARSVPALAGIEISTDSMTLVDAPCGAWDDHWKPATVVDTGTGLRIELQGAFPRRCTQRPALQLIDRQRLTESLFRTLWAGLGGQWSGRASEGATPPGARVLAQHEGRAWGEVLRRINKVSDNALTRTLFLLLGQRAEGTRAEVEPLAPTAELAQREVRAWFSERRIDARGLVLDNGSGLSRSARITPRQLASMLKLAHAAPYAPDLLMSLPVAGGDGMSRRFKEGPATGRARLKGGTLRNVAALAGIVPDAGNRPWVVVAMINHEAAAAARPALDALVEWVARSGARAARAPLIGPRADGP